MKNNLNKITLILTILLFLSVISFVWALATGTLYFTGTFNFKETADVKFINESIISIRPGESISLTNSSHTLNFTIGFEDPGDLRIIRFKLLNAGNVSVTLDELLTIDPEGLNITWPNLDGIIMSVGEISPGSGYYQIEVEWDEDYHTMPEYVNILASIEYNQS